MVDALDIASPLRETHVAWIVAGAAHGADILCQKPLSPTFAEAEAGIVRYRGRVCVMAHENWRFRPWYRYARKLDRPAGDSATSSRRHDEG